MKFIGLQAGHQFIKNNVDPLLRIETGAPGEVDFNIAVRDITSQILIVYGFQVQLDDANSNSNPNTIAKDFDFYLAIHAESTPTGGEVAAPDPSVDASNAESKRIVAAIEAVYFQDTGIADNEHIDNANMDFYYMWNVLTAKTPCGIIECGALQDPHDSVILSDHRRIALGIAHGICNAFGVEWKGDPFEPVQPIESKPTPPIVDTQLITPISTSPPPLPPTSPTPSTGELPPCSLSNFSLSEIIKELIKRLTTYKF